MQMSFFKSSVLTLATACATLAATPAAAQSYPDKPIRLVVTFAPGGSSDALARAVGKSMSEGLKTTIVVENRPGAGGVIGMDVVKNAAPDGYTILFATNGTHGIGPALYPGRKTDPVKDLAPIGMLHTLTNVLLVHPSVPANSVAELIAYAKANPGKLNFASATALPRTCSVSCSSPVPTSTSCTSLTKVAAPRCPTCSAARFR